jgi:hypothetical protein
MSKRFRAIHPSDMSKLERIVELMSRDAKRFAMGTADAIQDPIAREVADTLVGRARSSDSEVLGLVAELRHRVGAFNENLAGMAVA